MESHGHGAAPSPLTLNPPPQRAIQVARLAYWDSDVAVLGSTWPPLSGTTPSSPRAPAGARSALRLARAAAESRHGIARAGRGTQPLPPLRATRLHAWPIGFDLGPLVRPAPAERAKSVLPSGTCHFPSGACARGRAVAESRHGVARAGRGPTLYLPACPSCPRATLSEFHLGWPRNAFAAPPPSFPAARGEDKVPLGWGAGRSRPGVAFLLRGCPTLVAGSRPGAGGVPRGPPSPPRFLTYFAVVRAPLSRLEGWVRRFPAMGHAAPFQP